MLNQAKQCKHLNNSVITGNYDLLRTELNSNLKATILMCSLCSKRVKPYPMDWVWLVRVIS